MFSSRQYRAAFAMVCFLILGQPSVRGAEVILDLNADGRVDIHDIDIIVTTVGLGWDDPDLVADANLDGLIDQNDIDDWFECYSTEYDVPLDIARLDINFDSQNTYADYALIVANVGTDLTKFSEGNLVPDAQIDEADLEFYTLNGGVVPEPSTLVLVGLAGMILAARRQSAKTADGFRV